MSETQTKVFLALSDPHRLKLFKLIIEASKICKAEGEDFTYRGNCISNLQTHLHLSQSTISHHIAILEEARLIESVRKGKWIHLFPILETIEKIHSFTKEIIGSSLTRESKKETIEAKNINSTNFSELISLVSNHGAKVVHHNPLLTFFVSFQESLFSIVLNKSTIEFSLVSGEEDQERIEDLMALTKKYLSTIK